MILLKPFIKVSIQILFLIILAATIIYIIRKLLVSFKNAAVQKIIRREKTNPFEIEKRFTTLIRIFENTLILAVIIVIGMMISSKLGFDIMPQLGGMGIIGVAVGLGAQNLIKDSISGLSLIFENYIRIGDVVMINGTSGLVEQVNIRTTILRSIDGAVHVFQNGSINTLSNLTYEYSYYVFEITLSYKEDIDRILKLLNEIGADILKSEPYSKQILSPLEVFGIDRFSENGVVIKARIKTKPLEQWKIGREINLRIKNCFDKEKIEMSFSQKNVVIYPK